MPKHVQNSNSNANLSFHHHGEQWAANLAAIKHDIAHDMLLQSGLLLVTLCKNNAATPPTMTATMLTALPMKPLLLPHHHGEQWAVNLTAIQHEIVCNKLQSCLLLTTLCRKVTTCHKPQ